MAEHGDDSGFASRWSRRKVQARQAPGGAEASAAPVAPPPVALPAARLTPAPAALPAASAQVHAAAIETPPAPPAPTLEDVAALTNESDFARFVAPGVEPNVKNAAMKKLFTDPHYNVMDGLDTYIDDYNTSVPIPKSLLRQMVQARALGLLDDELVEQDKPAVPEPLNPHEDADLQLQPDDAPGRGGADEGPGPAGDERRESLGDERA